MWSAVEQAPGVLYSFMQDLRGCEWVADDRRATFIAPATRMPANGMAVTNVTTCVA